MVDRIRMSSRRLREWIIGERLLFTEMKERWNAVSGKVQGGKMVGSLTGVLPRLRSCVLLLG